MKSLKKVKLDFTASICHHTVKKMSSLKRNLKLSCSGIENKHVIPGD